LTERTSTVRVSASRTSGEDILQRRVGRRLGWLGVSAMATVAVCATAPAVAQDTGPAPKAQVGFERRAQLSPQEELAEADSILTRMDQAAAAVRRQLDRARQGRDVIKSLCLSDKLSQVDVAARSARDRQSALQAAVQRNDMELANHEFTILSVLRHRAEQLGAEANQCIGEEVAFVGQTMVVMSVEPNLPGVEDTTSYPPSPPPIVVSPPVPTSGMQ
jgi:hypothetical protein